MRNDCLGPESTKMRTAQPGGRSSNLAGVQATSDTRSTSWRTGGRNGAIAAQGKLPKRSVFGRFGTERKSRFDRQSAAQGRVGH